MLRRRRRFADRACRTLVAGLAAALSLLLAPAVLGATATVGMLGGNSFSPATVTITVGDTVSWSNQDASVPHTVTANDGSFDSGAVGPGGTYSRTFGTPGTFPYRCLFHPPGMVGTVVVKAAAPPGGGGAASNRATLPATDALDPDARSGASAAMPAAVLLMLAAVGVVLALATARQTMARQPDRQRLGRSKPDSLA